MPFTGELAPPLAGLGRSKACGSALRVLHIRPLSTPSNGWTLTRSSVSVGGPMLRRSQTGDETGAPRYLIRPPGKGAAGFSGVPGKAL